MNWFTAIEGTPTAPLVATILALISAVAHAGFGALQKGRYDPWLTRGSIDFSLLILSAPVALFVVPWPEARLIPLLAGMIVIHFIYKWLMAMAYTRGDFTAVYPVVRGTGPLVTVIFAMLIFGEHYGFWQWAGVVLLSGGILGLAAWNLSQTTLERARLAQALGIAFLGGFVVAIYTIYDAYGIRQTPNPFTFLAWFFFLTAFDFPVIGYLRWRRLEERPAPKPLLWRGFWGALIAFISFGGVMLATRLDKVGEAATLRETSVLFAALIGWFFLHETVGPRRLILMATIALGAIMVEFGA